MMKYVILISFFIAKTSMGAITVSELHSSSLSQAEFGPLNPKTIVKVHELLGEVGHEGLVQDALDKLGFENVEDLSFITQICDIKKPTRYGTYQRGQSSSLRKSIRMGVEIFATKWSEEILDEISKSYRDTYIEGRIFNTLVIQQWPTICLRRNLSLLKLATTFVHELVHYVSDDYSYEATLSSEYEFLHDTLYKHGGEFEAFSRQIRLMADIDEVFGTGHYLVTKFYSEDGDIDKEKLSEYILKDLNYEEKFSRNYKTRLLNKHTQLISNKEYIGKLVTIYNDNYDIYTSNLEIVISNREIYISNIDAYKHNIPLYKERVDRYSQDLEELLEDGRSQDTIFEIEDKVQENTSKFLAENENLQRTKELLKNSWEKELKIKEQIKFYEELSRLAQEEYEIQKEKIINLKKLLPVNKANQLDHSHGTE